MECFSQSHLAVTDDTWHQYFLFFDTTMVTPGCVDHKQPSINEFIITESLVASSWF